MLQVPSDPEEPFFILSLTEIPVSSSEEVIGRGSEPLHYPSATDNTPLQQQRLAPTLISQSARTDRHAAPEESLAVGADEPLSNVVVPRPKEESGKTGNSRAQDAGPDQAPSTVSEVARNRICLQRDEMSLFQSVFFSLCRQSSVTEKPVDPCGRVIALFSP